MQDHELIKQVAENDHKAFEFLYRRYKDKIYNTALAYVQNTMLAEEVVQEVFVKIYKSASSFKGQSTVSTWIYRIVINTSITTVNRHKKKASSELNVHEIIDFVHPGVILENQEKAKLLFKAINRLPSTQKTAFVLTYIEGLPQKEIAKIMNISVKAVESRLQRAKANLRKTLKKIR